MTGLFVFLGIFGVIVGFYFLVTKYFLNYVGWTTLFDRFCVQDYPSGLKWTHLSLFRLEKYPANTSHMHGGAKSMFYGASDGMAFYFKVAVPGYNSKGIVKIQQSDIINEEIKEIDLKILQLTYVKWTLQGIDFPVMFMKPDLEKMKANVN